MDYASLADSYARRYGLDPALYRALIQQESGWNPRARSEDGAYGLTQAMPDTARQPGYGVAPLRDPGRPDEQLRFGAEYLRAMLDEFGGDVVKALAAYNAGAGAVQKYGGVPPYDETQGYVRAILSNAGLGDLGVGPTRARAEAGLPLAVRGSRTHGPDGRFGDIYGAGRQAGLAEDPEERARRARRDTTLALLSYGQRLLNTA